jgi:hypothetical protein
MAILIKRTLAALAGAAILGAGAAAPKYDGYSYDGYDYDRYGEAKRDGRTYDPLYLEPSLDERRTYVDRDGRRYYRDRRGNWRLDGDWRADSRRWSEAYPSGEAASREQDFYNQGRDGRGWPQDGSHSGG